MMRRMAHSIGCRTTQRSLASGQCIDVLYAVGQGSHWCYRSDDVLTRVFSCQH